MRYILLSCLLLLTGSALALQELDKPTRLATLAAASPDRVIAEADAARLAGLPAINTYPQVIHKHPKPVDNPRKAVTKAARANGIDRQQLKCLHEIVSRESSYDPKADNPNSSAYGLFQQLKLKPNTPMQKQIALGLKYISHRYGTPCQALHFHDRNGWY